MTGHPDGVGRSEQNSQEEPAAETAPGGDGAASDLGEVMGRVARSLQEQHGDVGATLDMITAAAVGSVPGTDDCGITLVVDRRTVESRSPTGDMPRLIDDLQQRLGEGPCLDAIYEHETVRIDDIGSEDRWPRFSAEAPGLGMHSMLSFQLFVRGSTLGALNLYAREPHAFDEESESVGLVFASHGAIALAGAQAEEHLRAAIASRDLIGQAKGILMERFKVTADDAFQLLALTSSRTNRKLVDIAEELCRTGDMPPRGAGRAGAWAG